MEPVHFDQDFSVAADELDGSTTQNFGQNVSYEEVELLELADVIERDEIAYLLGVSAKHVAYIKSTATADSTVRSAQAILTSPNSGIYDGTSGYEAVDAQNGTMELDQSTTQANGPAWNSDSVIGRPMLSIGFNPFSDGATGVGGGGSISADWIDMHWSAGNGPLFDHRDTVWLGGIVENQNCDDASLHVETRGTLWFWPTER